MNCPMLIGELSTAEDAVPLVCDLVGEHAMKIYVGRGQSCWIKICDTHYQLLKPEAAEVDNAGDFLPDGSIDPRVIADQ